MTEAEKIAELRAHGFDMDNAFITQEGAVFDMACATCPRCCGKVTNDNRHFNTMIGNGFHCPHCELLFDEPHFEPAEVAYMAYIGEEDD